MNKKQIQYYVIITEAIAEMMKSGGELDIAELSQGNNLSDFIHALANAVPTRIYNELTNQDNNMLQFNHIANQLCFQNMTIDNKE